MSPHVVAAELNIARPETTSGWIFLIFVVVLVLFLLNQGMQSLTGMMQGSLRGTLILIVLAAVSYFVYTSRDSWGSDPVAKVEVFNETTNGDGSTNSSSIAGTATNSSAADGTDPNHVGDSERSHDD